MISLLKNRKVRDWCFFDFGGGVDWNLDKEFEFKWNFDIDWECERGCESEFEWR